jgi:WD40 repeat protein
MYFTFAFLINSIDMDPLGRYFVTGGVEAVVGIWEMVDMTCVRSISEKLEDPVTGCAFSFDGNYLAISTLSNIQIVKVSSFFTLIIQVATGEEFYAIKKNGATGIAWHPSKIILAFARSNHVCKKLDSSEKNCPVCQGDARRFNQAESTCGLFIFE